MLSPSAVLCSRRFAVSRLAPLPDRPIALPPCRLMRPTISLLILPTSTISTISTVSSSVTRMPPTNRGSLRSRFMSAPICGPPPCTMTGLMPTHAARSLAQPLHQRADRRAAPVHDDGIDADQLEQNDVEGEGLLEVGLVHGRAAVLDDDGLAAELPDVRERFHEDLDAAHVG